MSAFWPEPPAGTSVARQFRPLAAAILVLAAFNVFFRLPSQAITEWDESLYGLSAAEMLHTGDWIATRLLGQIDYFNIKPPLNVWMIALSFETFGIHPMSLRLPAALSAWLSVALLMWWARKAFNETTALVAGLVLATSFGALFVHSGRTANPDAPGTLLIVLTVIVLYASVERPWRRVWLGPILAAAFLLRGMGMLMPLAIVLAFECWRAMTSPGGLRRQFAIGPLVAAILFAAPVGAWAYARWSIDRFVFLSKLWTGEVARVTSPVESHTGSPLFYLNVLQKYQYEWVIAAALALLLLRHSIGNWRVAVASWRQCSPAAALLTCWAAVTLLIPTAMQTKTTWYLTPFYPAFALCVALVLVRAAEQAALARRRFPAIALLTLVTVAFGAAQGRIMWTATMRDAGDTAQGLLERTRTAVRGHAVFREEWTYADIFVVRELIGAQVGTAATVDDFLKQSRPGDYFVGSALVSTPLLDTVDAAGSVGLYRRR